MELKMGIILNYFEIFFLFDFCYIFHLFRWVKPSGLLILCQLLNYICLVLRVRWWVEFLLLDALVKLVAFILNLSSLEFILNFSLGSIISSPFLLVSTLNWKAIVPFCQGLNVSLLVSFMFICKTLRLAIVYKELEGLLTTFQMLEMGSSFFRCHHVIDGQKERIVQRFGACHWAFLALKLKFFQMGLLSDW